MTFEIRLLTADDVPTVVDFSLRAWAPVFASFEKVLGSEIYSRVYPDWLASQARDVARVCTEHAEHTLVAVRDGRPVGFAASIHDREASSGEIEMIAVDPDHQRRGIAAALIAQSLERMRADGLTVAGIGTGGDPGHAPARAAYEKAGFTALPLVHYYKAL
ncbi:GNAT superfamily N-acetyltransferase [Actinoplanes lutulentus]|uniref:Ribosomal protein S18 acetylase RimI-like enzyme n=1 Tax=Actinoplanes lutulentus TaxID=1287878 RepID=A0A327Z7L3_9ACTN|nr:GNAT family N-acetyltransferase [Actinoplanes lutulentus]MBB2942247.1 GNAT superfamily N-acetyltransferase [Actinoplanes lutulentus]RAK33016.1 ribosomal protein S18 acetylase RimI-like enzyme [Actinoplanes lutulentus]